MTEENKETTEKKNLVIELPEEFLESLRKEIKSTLKVHELLKIENLAEGFSLEMQSATKGMTDLINDAFLVKSNFFNKKEISNSYIG